MQTFKDKLEAAVYILALAAATGAIAGPLFLLSFLSGMEGAVSSVGMLTSASLLGAAYLTVVAFVSFQLSSATLFGMEHTKAITPSVSQNGRNRQDKILTEGGIFILYVVNLMVASVTLVITFNLDHKWYEESTLGLASFFVIETFICGLFVLASYHAFENLDYGKIVPLIIDAFPAAGWFAQWCCVAFLLGYLKYNEISDLDVNFVIIIFMSLGCFIFFSLFIIAKYPKSHGVGFVLIFFFLGLFTIYTMQPVSELLIRSLRLGGYTASLTLDAGAFDSVPNPIKGMINSKNTADVCVLLNFGDMVFVQFFTAEPSTQRLIALKADKVVAITPALGVTSCSRNLRPGTDVR